MPVLSRVLVERPLVHRRPARTARASTDPWGADLPRQPLRTRLTLARQDRRSAVAARRHSALGLLMSAERLEHVLVPAMSAQPCSAAGRDALDVLWRTLYRSGRGTPDWNPGLRHLHQAADVQRWRHRVTRDDLDGLLRSARRMAESEFRAARTGRRTAGRSTLATALPC